MFPGSAHPTGEPVEWYENGAPAALDAAELKAAAGRLAAASMLLRARARERPARLPVGRRRRAGPGLGPDRAKPSWRRCRPGVLADRPTQAAGEVRRMVDGAAELLAEGDEPVTGWPKLVEELGDKRTAALAEWLGIEARAGPAATTPVRTSHDALALELGREWDGTAKHVALWGRWLFWTGPSGRRDERSPT